MRNCQVFVTLITLCLISMSTVQAGNCWNCADIMNSAQCSGFDLVDGRCTWINNACAVNSAYCSALGLSSSSCRRGFYASNNTC